jgi:hypothetical protein
MISPTMSFAVVTNGPVANAGSIFNLSNISGKKVPLRLANMITLKSAMDAVKLKINSK